MPASHPDTAERFRTQGDVLENHTKVNQNAQNAERVARHQPNRPQGFTTQNAGPEHSNFIELFELLLRSKQAAHVLALISEKELASSFLNALADHLAGTKRVSCNPYGAVIEKLRERIPRDGVSRFAFEALVRDLVWEIDQYQCS